MDPGGSDPHSGGLFLSQFPNVGVKVPLGFVRISTRGIRGAVSSP